MEEVSPLLFTSALCEKINLNKNNRYRKVIIKSSGRNTQTTSTSQKELNSTSVGTHPVAAHLAQKFSNLLVRKADKKVINAYGASSFDLSVAKTANGYRKKVNQGL